MNFPLYNQFNQMSVDELSKIERDFPYFVLPRWVALKKGKMNPTTYTAKLEQTAMYAYDREALYNFIHEEDQPEKFVAEKELIGISVDSGREINLIAQSESLNVVAAEKEEVSNPTEMVVPAQIEQSNTAIEPIPIEEKIEEPVLNETVNLIEKMKEIEKAELGVIKGVPTIAKTENETVEINEIPELVGNPVVESKTSNEIQIETKEEERVDEVKVDVKEEEHHEEIKLEEIEPTKEETDVQQSSERYDQIIEEASTNSFLQWLKIVEKKKAEVVEEKVEAKPIIEKVMPKIELVAEEKVKIKKDPDLFALDNFVKDQLKKKKKKPTPAHVIELPFEQAMQKSVEEFEVVTEGMAILLVNQKKYDHAVAVYEKLILKIPEKSAFFATQIERIKSKS